MIDTKKYKEILETELLKLENELKTVGRKNPSNPSDWEATQGTEIEADIADRDEVADAIESYEERTAILKDLEIRYNEVKDALRKITDGKYGICEKCGEQIEEKKLVANPAAKNCIKDTK